MTHKCIAVGQFRGGVGLLAKKAEIEQVFEEWRAGLPPEVQLLGEPLVNTWTGQVIAYFRVSYEGDMRVDPENPLNRELWRIRQMMEEIGVELDLEKTACEPEDGDGRGGRLPWPGPDGGGWTISPRLAAGIAAGVMALFLAAFLLALFRR